MTDQHSAGGHTDLMPLREFLKFRYSAPSESCKCGNCQLVPAADLARFATEDETLRRNLRHWREECGKLHARVFELEKALRSLCLGYVNLMEIGRDRIGALGGACDPVDVMEAGDPVLRAARATLSSSRERG